MLQASLVKRSKVLKDLDQALLESEMRIDEEAEELKGLDEKQREKRM